MNDPNNVVDMDRTGTNVAAAQTLPKSISDSLALQADAAALAPPTKSLNLLILLAILWAIVGSGGLYFWVLCIWCIAAGTGSAGSASVSEFYGLMLVGLLGAIGGFVRCLHTFTRCFSQEVSLIEWGVSTCLTPLKSALLALIVALIIKAGLVSAPTSGNSTNWLGIYAIAALVGLFANEAVSKLEEVFKTIFGTTQKTAPPKQATSDQ